MTYFTHKSGPLRGAPAVHALYEGEARVEREGYSTDLFADRAIDIVKRADPKPFFLSLHFNAPHWPWEGPQDQGKAAEHPRDGALRGRLSASLSRDDGEPGRRDWTRPAALEAVGTRSATR